MSLLGRRKNPEASEASYRTRFMYLLLVPLSFLIKWLMSTNPEFTEKILFKRALPYNYAAV